MSDLESQRSVIQLEHKTRGYYAIIPANIRYDQNITANAKLLYGEITALCNEKGYCWATNKYFADLYGASIRTVQMWISALEELGYIKTRLKETETGSQRYILLSQTSPPHEENFTPPCKNFQGGDEENFTHNITSNNTSNNTPPISPTGGSERFEKFWSAYPRKVGKGAAEKAFKKYKPDDTLLSVMLSALSAQKRSEQWIKENGKFIPYPATWLNQRRWEDAPEERESGWKTL